MVIEMHHVKPEEKCFNLSGANLTKPLRDLTTEAAKCVALCANHHRLADAGLIEFDEGEYGVYDHATTFRFCRSGGDPRLIHDGR